MAWRFLFVYTEETLATAFDTPLPIVRLALETFKNLEMINIYDDFLCISNWEKYQNCDALEKIREKTRNRVASHRAKQRELSGCNVTVTLPVTHGNATEEEREEDKDKEEDKERDIEGVGKAATHPVYDYEFYKSSFNSICSNFPKCRDVTEKRKKAIRDYEKQMGKESFEEVCRAANTSPFCTGKNDRNWKADFDFLIRADKATSILEGKYGSGGFAYQDSYEEGTSF